MDFCDAAHIREREEADAEYEQRLRRLTGHQDERKKISQTSMMSYSQSQRNSVLEQSRNLVKRTSQLQRNMSPHNQNPVQMKRISVAQSDNRRGSVAMQTHNNQLTRRISALTDDARRGSKIINHK